MNVMIQDPGIKSLGINKINELVTSYIDSDKFKERLLTKLKNNHLMANTPKNVKRFLFNNEYLMNLLK
ncbi:hypothetical protein CWM47_16395 [Spirosoma pollinicola]|uniref:Uncharacterized protein n=1 Tax=Spirosoma pollinicola TaxID=2057025 RepID=A0A2K8Z0C5_9BACT|nr:hypothetical protein CWM47_16395 [Spirosoma pollinicola]